MSGGNQFALGIDVGSGGIKCVLIDRRGSIVGASTRSYRTSYPAPGLSEQDPCDWYSAAVAVVRDVVRSSGITVEGLECIGICGTGHTPVLLDGAYRVVRPAILWTDQRSTAQVQYLIAHWGPDILATTYNQANCTWTLPQIMWVRENEPDAFAHVRHLLVSKDYLLLRFTGVLAADVGSATSTLMMDASRKEWSPLLSRLSGLPASALPPILSPCEIAGVLTRECAADLGFPEGIRVIAGTLDSAAEVLGVGAIGPGQGMVRLGTAGGVMIVTDRPCPSQDVITYPHTVNHFWYAQAATNTCATALQWVGELVATLPEQENMSSPFYAELDRLAAAAPPGCEGLIFHPFLLGERAPYWNPDLRASFTGASMHHGKAHFVRAVQEGVAFSIRDCLESLLRLGLDVKEIRLGGGGSKSALWSQIVCDVLGMPGIRIGVDDSAYGVALMAATAAGFFPDLKEAVKACVVEEGLISPSGKLHELYSRHFEAYKTIQHALAPIYSEKGRR